MKRDMKTLGVPPAGSVHWKVSRKRTGEKLGTVLAQTWFAARRKAMKTFGAEASEIDVSLENGG